MGVNVCVRVNVRACVRLFVSVGRTGIHECMTDGFDMCRYGDVSVVVCLYSYMYAGVYVCGYV